MAEQRRNSLIAIQLAEDEKNRRINEAAKAEIAAEEERKKNKKIIASLTTRIQETASSERSTIELESSRQSREAVKVATKLVQDEQKRRVSIDDENRKAILREEQEARDRNQKLAKSLQSAKMHEIDEDISKAKVFEL